MDNFNTDMLVFVRFYNNGILVANFGDNLYQICAKYLNPFKDEAGSAFCSRVEYLHFPKPVR